eukprot:ANDGO_00316.mRNA.1 hypothetical protein
MNVRDRNDQNREADSAFRSPSPSPYDESASTLWTNLLSREEALPLVNFASSSRGADGSNRVAFQQTEQMWRPIRLVAKAMGLCVGRRTVCKICIAVLALLFVSITLILDIVTVFVEIGDAKIVLGSHESPHDYDWRTRLLVMFFNLRPVVSAIYLNWYFSTGSIERVLSLSLGSRSEARQLANQLCTFFLGSWILICVSVFVSETPWIGYESRTYAVLFMFCSAFIILYNVAYMTFSATVCAFVSRVLALRHVTLRNVVSMERPDLDKILDEVMAIVEETAAVSRRFTPYWISMLLLSAPGIVLSFFIVVSFNENSVYWPVLIACADVLSVGFALWHASVIRMEYFRLVTFLSMLQERRYRKDVSPERVASFVAHLSLIPHPGFTLLNLDVERGMMLKLSYSLLTLIIARLLTELLI